MVLRVSYDVTSRGFLRTSDGTANGRLRHRPATPATVWRVRSARSRGPTRVAETRDAAFKAPLQRNDRLRLPGRPRLSGWTRSESAACRRFRDSAGRPLDRSNAVLQVH